MVAAMKKKTRLKMCWLAIKDDVTCALNRLVARVTGEDLFWEYEDPWGRKSDGQYETEGEAAEAAAEAFQREYDDYEWDGESISGPEEEGEIILTQAFASDDGRVTRRLSATVYADGDSGGFTQESHGTWNKAMTGVS